MYTPLLRIPQQPAVKAMLNIFLKRKKNKKVKVQKHHHAMPFHKHPKNEPISRNHKLKYYM